MLNNDNNTCCASIMIVEDELLVATDLKICLENAGYAVCALARSGTNAVCLAQHHAPDIILMDIILKGDMSGIEAVKMIKSYQDVAIIFLTAHSDGYTLEKASAIDSHGYIIKPYNEYNLLKVLRQTLTGA